MTFGRFFLPGPTEVHPDVLKAMLQPMIPHRGPACEELFAAVQPGLQACFGTEDTILIAASSATGMMEAGVRLLPPGRVLALVNGAFSERYARIAEACGFEVDRLEIPWGLAHDPREVGDRIAADHVGVLAVHNETSTGAFQDLPGLARAAGNVPLLVDSVSGIGGTPFQFDRWGLAFACTGSQKALALPPGLAFAAVSPALLEGAARSAPRGYYLDLERYDTQQPPFTPALPQLYALRRQLKRIAKEGLEARFARHTAMAERTQAWAGDAVLAPPGARSPTVTAVRAPRAPDVVRRIAERGYTVGYGYGKLRDSTFRIGHMGDQTLDTLEPLLAVCDEALR